MTPRRAIILAAGKGTRMNSDLPKVLCKVLGKSMLEHVLDRLAETGVLQPLIVVGYRAELVKQQLAGRHDVVFVEQQQQLGTGHAVQVCEPQLRGKQGPLLVLTGDSPLIQQASLEQLYAYYESHQAACVMGTLQSANPAGLGRIVRDSAGEFTAIVEYRDATPQQREIREVNMSTYLFDIERLCFALAQLTNSNEQREYYLTDCPGILRAAGEHVAALDILQPCEALSVNTAEDLQEVEKKMKELGYPNA